MGTDKHLKLRAAPNSALGLVITHIQESPTNNQELASATLRGRFLPFKIAQDDPRFREIAIRCAHECEAWARAIREYAGLGTSPVLTSIVGGQLNQNSNDLDSLDPDFDQHEQFETEEDFDPELEARKRQRRDDALGF